jgi:hypothetical protein
MHIYFSYTVLQLVHTLKNAYLFFIYCTTLFSQCTSNLGGISVPEQCKKGGKLTVWKYKHWKCTVLYNSKPFHIQIQACQPSDNITQYTYEYVPEIILLW